MTDFIRITISLSPSDGGWNETIDSEILPQQLTRTLRAVSAGTAQDLDACLYPLPPEDDLPAATESHAKLCGYQQLSQIAQNLTETYDHIKDRQTQPTDIEVFGHYLFQTVFGRLWTDILAAVIAHAPSCRVIELALMWPANENNLHRLNWEMMYGPENFLALGVTLAGTHRYVAITRVVSGAHYQPGQIDSCPKMLFVIGTPLHDPSIKPGAEVLSLLRQFKKENRSINTHLLQDASPEKIKAEIGEFRPNIVHFICHGDWDDYSGHGYLELQLDKNETLTQRKRYADQLLQILNKEGELPLPTVVVLSACGSGTVLGPAKVAPLAAEMVKGGVPVVVGMAGRVSDLACRLFTRRFGDALIQGVPLALAAAQARRYAFADLDVPPSTAPDWAFPTIFMSQDVLPGYAAVSPAATADHLSTDNWIRNYKLNTFIEPVFCNRDIFFEAYNGLFHNQPVLVAWADKEGLGLWRLVRELAAQAMRDGHLPLVIGRLDDPNVDLNKLDFLLAAIFAEFERLRRALELDVFKGQLFHLHTDGHPDNNNLDAEIRMELEANHGDVTPKALALALSVDIEHMNECARRVLGPQGRPLILFHGVHRYATEFLDALPDVLTVQGLSSKSTASIPVVLAFVRRGISSEFFSEMVESKNTWMRREQLEPFPSKDDQDLQILQRILLHPYAYDNPLLRDEDRELLRKAYVINPKLSQTDEIYTYYVDGFRRKGGLPGEIVASIAEFVYYAKGAKFLQAADDDLLMDKMRRE